MNEPLPKEWEDFGEIPIGQGLRLSPLVFKGYFTREFVMKGKYDLSNTMWSYNLRGTSTDTRPTNITEGAD